MYDVYYGKDGKSNDFMNLLDKKEIDVSDIQVFFSSRRGIAPIF